MQVPKLICFARHNQLVVVVLGRGIVKWGSVGQNLEKNDTCREQIHHFPLVFALQVQLWRHV